MLEGHLKKEINQLLMNFSTRRFEWLTGYVRVEKEVPKQAVNETYSLMAIKIVA